eukprot:TRINITY_DN91751_c0_g2_i1.p1 TRINITY_DN91751_c0_g2~~TRINITY_DN91751_c0_g2_i1.p1  ORF type:complete len:111 (-),score=6.27 TRINITY_DN91751_c0_g2_i1:10-342(-)
MHSLISVQIGGDPMYPGGQGPHDEEPFRFMHWTNGIVSVGQPPLFVRHSLVSAQLKPFPRYPEGQRPHEKFPSVFVQFTNGTTEQPPFPVEIGRAVQQECRDRSRMPSSA